MNEINGTMTTYMVHPFMLIYPRKIESKRTFVIDLRSNEVPLIVENPLLVWALSALPSEFTRDEAVAVWSREEKAAEYVDDIWDFALTEGLLIPLPEASELKKRVAFWESIAWGDAAVYHEATRDYPFVDMSHKNAFVADNERMKDYEEAGVAPPVYKSFSALESVPLVKVTDDFNSYLSKRKGAVDWKKDLSLLFDFCFGERLRLEHEFDERNFLQLESLRKTVPSGGGRHPTESFIAVLDEKIGIRKGLYHYNVQFNKLDLLREIPENFLVNLADLPANTEAVLFLASFCERAMWRYRDPRSWRAFVIDVGHVEAMCSLVCKAIDYSFMVCHEFNAREAARLLKLDPLRTPVMSMAALRRVES